MPKSRHVLECPHGRRPFYEDCPECRQEQSDRWRADELARLDPERDTARDDFGAWLATDPTPCESEVAT